MYSFTSNVRFSETDETGLLSLVGLMNYLQDCCLFQSESLGVGPKNLKKRHRLWLLSGWQIVIDRYPEMFEKITVETIPYAFSGCLGWRNVLILDERGNCIVRANSPWVFVNMDTGKPERPDEVEMAAYQTEERIPMDYAPRKIRLPEEMQECEAVPVVQDYIDSNHHVNNARYIEIAVELLKAWELKTGTAVSGSRSQNRDICSVQGLKPKELRVEYKRQAQLGDILYPKIGEEGGWKYVALENWEGAPYAVVAVKLKNS
ncbi:MAG: thioesterase [Lachnospiraceae bacterium]|nr:thioesterase [Lachnospiraceae bacterium]